MLIISIYFGSYSLYRNRIGFINKLIDYQKNQKHLFIPTDINKLLSIIVNYDFFGVMPVYWDSNNKGRVYYYVKKYIIWIFIYIIINYKDKIVLKFDKFGFAQLVFLKQFIRELRSDILPNINKNLLIDTLNVKEEAIIENTKGLFDEIIEKAGNQYNSLLRSTDLSLECFKSFEQSFVKLFYENCKLRNIINDMGLLNYKVRHNEFNIVQNVISDRCLFINECGGKKITVPIGIVKKVIYKDGNKIMESFLNNFFIEEYIKNENIINTIENKLNLLSEEYSLENIVIFAIGSFKTNYYIITNERFKEIRNSVVEGLYIFSDNNIKSYYYPSDEVKDQILIFNKNKVGKLNQYIKEDTIGIQDNRNIFEFSFSDLLGEENMQKYCDENDDKNIADLSNKVSIRIKESFQYDRPSGQDSKIIGYKVFVDIDND